MRTRAANSLVQGQLVFEMANQDRDHGVDDRPPTGAPCHQDNPTILSHNRRRLRTQHPFSRLDGVGLRSDSTLHIGAPGDPVEVTHFVIENESRTDNDNFTSPTRLQCIGVGDSHSVSIHNREMRRLIRLLNDWQWGG